MPSFAPGPVEIIIILAVLLLVLGPSRLPDLGSALGKTIRDFRKAVSDVQEEASLEPRPAAPAAPASSSAPSDVAPPPAGSAPAAASSAPATEPSVPPASDPDRPLSAVGDRSVREG